MMNLPPMLGRGVPASEKRAALRAIIDSPRATLVPGVFDGLTAIMAERSGFSVGYVTGAGVANSQLAAPDVGILQFDAMALQVRRIVAATTIPMIVDADTGFGGPPSVMYVVRTLESLGAAGIQIEDQVMPKRCGHFDGKSVVEVGEMQAKVAAAVRARSDDNFTTIARTDAATVEGIDAALVRARAYREAGADAVFVEAPRSEEDLRTVARELAGTPVLINIVEGGRTPEREVVALEHSATVWCCAPTCCSGAWCAPVWTVWPHSPTPRSPCPPTSAGSSARSSST
jgi:2-methylisocitrate lyase-like PEP mutase family enzyme